MIIYLGLFLILCQFQILDDDVDGRDVLWAGTSGGDEHRSSNAKTLFGQYDYYIFYAYANKYKTYKKYVLFLLLTPILFIVKGTRELQKQSVPQLPAQLLRHTDDVCSDPRLQTVQIFVQERSLCTHHGLHLPWSRSSWI